MRRRELLKIAAWVPFSSIVCKLAKDGEVSTSTVNADDIASTETDEEDSSSDSPSYASSCSCTGRCMAGIATCSGVLHPWVTQGRVDSYWNSLQMIRRSLGDDVSIEELQSRYPGRATHAAR